MKLFISVLAIVVFFAQVVSAEELVCETKSGVQLEWLGVTSAEKLFQRVEVYSNFETAQLLCPFWSLDSDVKNFECAGVWSISGKVIVARFQSQQKDQFEVSLESDRQKFPADLKLECQKPEIE